MKREEAALEEKHKSQVAWEQQAISIITNYNIEHTDLGTILANHCGQPLGPLQSRTQTEILEEGEAKDERGNYRERGMRKRESMCVCA